MKNRKFELYLLFLSTLSTPVFADNGNDSTLCQDSRYAKEEKPHLVTSILENVGINATIYSADRWLLGREYSISSFSEIKENFRKGLKYDGDQFHINFFAHPYHGALYYTAARSNNLSFLASSACTLAGSLIWEECAETDDPSINDIFSTTFGGIAFGEVMTRLSRLPLNDKTRGRKRFFREMLSTAISPMSGLNRVLYGKAWTVKDEHYLYHNREETPYDIRFTLGYSHFNGGKEDKSCTNVPYLGIDIEYGDVTEGGNRAYDNFTLNAVFTPVGNRPIINRFDINGSLIGWQIAEKEHTKASVSFRQDFTYYDYEKTSFITDGRESLLRMCETAALGVGVAQQSEGRVSFLQQLQCHAVMMGGYTSDYYSRDYNIGSGFNVKYLSKTSLGDRASLGLNLAYHYLFVWKDYETEQLEKNPELTTFNTNISRRGGDNGHAAFFIIQPKLDIRCSQSLYLTTSLDIFTRHSHYRYHENVNSRYFDFKVGLSYQL